MNYAANKTILFHQNVNQSGDVHVWKSWRRPVTSETSNKVAPYYLFEMCSTTRWYGQFQVEMVKEDWFEPGLRAWFQSVWDSFSFFSFFLSESHALVFVCYRK